MRILATILSVATLLGAAYAPPVRGESTAEVVLIGRSELLAQNAPAPSLPAPRRVTRIERFVEPALTMLSEPTLESLDDQQAPLLEAIPKSQPILEHLVVPPRQVDSRQSALGNLTPAAGPFASEVLPVSLFDTSLQPASLASTTIAIISILMAVVALRRWILAAASRLVLGLVVAVNHRGATISSAPRRRRRSRFSSSSRRHAPDVSWYFRKTAESGSGKSRRRRRWSTTSRPREYVVTDVVYATAPVQPVPRYLLTNSVN
jgi:hypothetical protein